MFLPWSFFEIQLFFLVLDILVAASFMAGLAHISRRVRHHAHSVRWIKQAGVLEMVKALWNSFRKVTGRPRLLLLATFIGSLALTGILVVVKTFANIATTEGTPSREVVVSKQFVYVNAVTTLPAWSIPIPYDNSMTDVLVKALNNTKAIPRASPTKRYRPHLSEYDLACNQLAFTVSAPFGNNSRVVTDDGCATLNLYVPSSKDTNLTGMTIFQESNGRAKIVIPARGFNLLPKETIDEPSLFFRVKYQDQFPCSIFDRSPQLVYATRIGHSSAPLTVSTKCQLLSGEMVSLAVASIRFSVPEPKMFHSIATTIFETQNELVSSMEKSVNNGTLISQSLDRLAQVIVMEVKIAGTEVSALMCSGSNQDALPRIMCVYIVAHTLITKPRPANPDITGRFPEGGISTEFPTASVLMTLYHLPDIKMGKPSFAIPKILNSSSVTATYLASLGQNFILDWEGSTAYIAYDTVEIIKGYEIPTGLFYSMIGVMVICLLFCAATEYWVEGRYKRSLYWQVAQSLAPPEDKALPELHRFVTAKLEFEGRRIVSTNTTVYQ
ncbi:hypothetical protein BG015_001230 [Linnemannia schmuckeri]|uniref:Transmembrane protein n=1 Tax=Linnemannia schmuckeri TaxID=64567 RepID=A0A9P5V771_9FUNG|nr:hypothetical protein BG015_001230 [Linnemannia schmuckeri]